MHFLINYISINIFFNKLYNNYIINSNYKIIFISSKLLKSRNTYNITIYIL